MTTYSHQSQKKDKLARWDEGGSKRIEYGMKQRNLVSKAHYAG